MKKGFKWLKRTEQLCAEKFWTVHAEQPEQSELID